MEVITFTRPICDSYVSLFFLSSYPLLTISGFTYDAWVSLFSLLLLLVPDFLK